MTHLVLSEKEKMFAEQVMDVAKVDENAAISCSDESSHLLKVVLVSASS